MSTFVKSLKHSGRSSPTQSHPAVLIFSVEPDRQLQIEGITSSAIINRTKWTSSELSQELDHAARYGGVPDWSCAVEGRSACQCRRVWSRNVSKTLRDALEARSLLEGPGE